MKRIKRALKDAAATAALCVAFSAAVAAVGSGAALAITILAGSEDGVWAAAAGAARLFG